MSASPFATACATLICESTYFRLIELTSIPLSLISSLVTTHEVWLRTIATVFFSKFVRSLYFSTFSGNEIIAPPSAAVPSNITRSEPFVINVKSGTIPVPQISRSPLPRLSEVRAEAASATSVKSTFTPSSAK